MPSPRLHLDPKLEKLTLAEAGFLLELRVCCVCGVIKEAKDFENCLACDGFICDEHSSTEVVPIEALAKGKPTKGKE